MATNGSMYAEMQYSILLIDGLSVDSCNEFYSNVAYSGNRRYKTRKALLFQIALNVDDQNENKKKVALSLLRYICEASTHCILANKNISGLSKEKICNNIINCSTHYIFDLRYYYLLGRQFKRKTYSLDAYFWLNTEKQNALTSNNELAFMFQCFQSFGIAKNERQSPPKSPSREVLANQANVYKSQGKKGIGISAMTEAERDDFDQARMDFKVFQHLLFSEWRRRICHYLGSYLAEEYPWYAAWYFLESRAIYLRQLVRLRKTDSLEDLRFKDIVEFKTAVRALPTDFTLVQLIVDEQNVLWLVRCGYDLIPIVLPLTKTNVGKDDISHRMYNILLENDQSVEGNIDRTKFWAVRDQLNKKLENLISDVEYKWLDKFRVLLIPFGNINAGIQKNLKAAKDILKNAGFSEERAKASFLSKLFLHAYQDDYKYLLSIFSFIERETFGNPINASLQERLYQKLTKACPENSFETYLKEDRFTVLIVSPEISCYPWESLPIFSANPYVLRIQSFHFFDRLTKKGITPLPLNARSQDSYYVLNPSGDLKSTEKRIGQHINLKKLDGLSGQFPPAEKFLEVLEKNDFFLYMGHGSGVRYVGSSTVRRAFCKAVAILMGCSSVRIEDQGNGFDGISAVNDYTVAGAPCTIGCLWMVTDGEIDRFLINFVERCFTEWSSNVSNSAVYKTVKESGDGIKVQYPYRLLIKAIVQARQACRLKTLTGGSVVVYGIPVFNDQSSLEMVDNTDDSVIIIDDN
uniref:Separase n=1 Tax=Panagrolaimus sp. ES5 TaxID=591445 RepID=A0AC34GQ22_9BILA